MATSRWLRLLDDSASREFESVQLGDRRLNGRAMKISEALEVSPSESLPRLAGDDSELTALYRFVNNERVTPAKLVAPHERRVVQRATGLDEVLVVHDTTEFAFSGADRKALHRLSGGNRGFFAHLSLVLTRDVDPIPLGVVATQFVHRDEAPRTSRKATYKFEGNSAARWETGAARAEQLLRPITKPVHVMDREGDSYLLIKSMLDAGRRFIIRSNHDRTLDAARGEPRKLGDLLVTLPEAFVRKAKLASRKPTTMPAAARRHPPREERVASLSVSATRVSLKRPHHAPKDFPKFLELNVVHLVERDPPPGAAPVEWTLLTTESIDTPEGIAAIVDAYRSRWVIEELFKALKTGCSIESRGFDECDALEALTALYIPIAWHMLLLRTLARSAPDASAASIFTRVQVAVIVARGRRLPPSQRPASRPTIAQALAAIAAFGGHLRRNGPPGWQTLAKGYAELRHLCAGFSVAEALRGDVSEG